MKVQWFKVHSKSE